MNNSFIKTMRKGLLITGTVALTFTACNPEPDESDLYTFTGRTIESFIQEDSTLTSFNYILTRVGYDKMMSAYGSYTCFAPTNDGVAFYIDSLYNDVDAVIPHNGMRQPEGVSASYESQTPEERLQWLSDSLCLTIARYHITSSYKNIVSLTGSGEVNTMLGYEFGFTPQGDKTLLGGKALIISSDNETINGLVHVIDNVIPRFTRFIGDVFDRNKDTYSIFGEALKLTGLDDSLLNYTRGVFTFNQLTREKISLGIYPSKNVGGSGQMECKVGYTVFAESDEVMHKNNINSVDDLIAYANKVYANAPQWYDYMRENGLTVSTGDDYTNTFNALHMFMAYHIVKANMSVNWLVYDKGADAYWNFAPDADPYDYYDTMLPHTMMKIWEPHDVGNGKSLFINRYQTYNTLTNELASPGTNHELVRPGVGINRSASLQAFNGYIHSINNMLVYDQLVPKGVLHERMRVNCTSLFPELITNRIRSINSSDNLFSGYEGGRYGIPVNYFENMVYFVTEPSKSICLNYCTHGAMRCWESDQMQVWGAYDIAFKLPSVPSDVYELRVVYAPMSYGSFMQYYIGTSSSVATMMPIGLPFDATIPVTDPRVGITNPAEEADYGVATDIALHNHGYMRGPYSYCGHAESTGWTTSNNGRFEFGASMTIRYVLGTVELKQGTENWLRIKSLNTNLRDKPVGIDYVELVPTSVLDNQQYTEDWY